jgi:allantoicase
MGSGYPETRHNLHRIENDAPWTHLRLNIYPDGGVARLRVFGSVTMDWTRIAASTLIDLVSAVHGGTVVKYSDAHYGHPKNLIGPGRGKTMADGWETARKKTRPAILKADPKTGLLQVPGKDWTILKLGHAGIIKEIEVDTNHFKGNFPESCILYGCYYSGLEKDLVSFSSNNNIQWKIVLPRVKLQAHTQHFFSIQENTVNLLNHPINYVRLEMFPDGGISRLRLFGHKAMTTSSITSKSKL